MIGWVNFYFSLSFFTSLSKSLSSKSISRLRYISNSFSALAIACWCETLPLPMSTLRLCAMIWPSRAYIQSFIVIGFISNAWNSAKSKKPDTHCTHIANFTVFVDSGYKNPLSWKRYWASIAKRLSRQVLILYPIGCKM